jgi:DNA-binding phage protein
MPGPAPRTALPDDLPRLLVEMNKAVNSSKMDIATIAATIQERPENLYRWLIGKGAPRMAPMEATLNVIGYRLVIVEADGLRAEQRREAVRQDPNRISVPMQLRNRELPTGVHPMMVEVFLLLNELRANRSKLCADAGVGRGTFGQWLRPSGKPLLMPVDNILRQAGYRLKVARGLLGPRRPEVKTDMTEQQS